MEYAIAAFMLLLMLLLVLGCIKLILARLHKEAPTSDDELTVVYEDDVTEFEAPKDWLQN